MLQARTHPSVRIRSIFNRTRGVLFFGTRHVGKYRDSVLCRWGIFYSRLFSFVMIGRDFWRLLEDPEIERSNARFTPFLGQILITSFYGDHPDIAGEVSKLCLSKLSRPNFTRLTVCLVCGPIRCHSTGRVRIYRNTFNYDRHGQIFVRRRPWA